MLYRTFFGFYHSVHIDCPSVLNEISEIKISDLISTTTTKKNVFNSLTF